MICAHSLRHRNIVKNGRPRNLFTLENPGIGTSQAGKNHEDLLKNQTGRPYSAPYGGPHGVLLPFLAEDLALLYHRRKYFTSPEGVQFLRYPNRRLAQNSRSPPPDAIAILGLFRSGTYEISRAACILLISLDILIADNIYAKD